MTNNLGMLKSCVNYNPEGLLIFLADDNEDENFDIFSMKEDGSNVTKLSQGELNFNGPLWQYENYIVYQHDKDIWSYDVEAHSYKALTDGVGINYSHSLFEE